MKSNPYVTLPQVKTILIQLGKKIKERRKSRMITATKLAIEVGTSRSTIGLIEKGSTKVAMGTYMQVMYCLGFQRELTLLVQP